MQNVKADQGNTSLLLPGPFGVEFMDVSKLVQLVQRSSHVPSATVRERSFGAPRSSPLGMVDRKTHPVHDPRFYHSTLTRIKPRPLL